MRGPAVRRCRRSTSRPPGAARRRRSARRSCTRGVPACWATRDLGSRTRTCGISRRRGLASRRASRSARSSRADGTPRPASPPSNAAPSGCIATSSAAPAVLAAQRRGRAGATLGEIRQRADLVVFWAVDPSGRYPRYGSRYAVDPRGVAAPQGRQSRTLVAVDVGENLGPADANGRVAIAPGDEVDSLEVMRATVQGRAVGEDARFRPAVELARRMTGVRYVVIVADGEPGVTPVDPARAEALVTLAQALNGPT